MRSADGTYGAVEATAFVYAPQPMYNLTVAAAHTYFVGDGQWLVHNNNLICGYPKAEWDARVATTDMHKMYECWACAIDMHLKFGDDITFIHNKKYGQPLLGPSGSDIGAPAGWHVVTIDTKRKRAWDNFGHRGSSRTFINSILKENPGAVEKTFSDIYEAKDYLEDFIGWNK